MVETTYEAQVRQIAAFDDLLEYFQGQKPRWDGDVSDAQAGYTALANNLRAVVKSQMFFSATIDPDEAEPTNVDGGTFSTIKSAVDASPHGSYVSIYLKKDKVYEIDGGITVGNRVLDFQPVGNGAENPQVNVGVYSTGVVNNLYSMVVQFGAVHFSGVTISLPTEKVDAALPWTGDPSMIRYIPRGLVFIGLSSSVVNGGAADVTIGLANARYGGTISAGIYNSTLDGPLSAIIGGAQGIVTIARQAVTLANGATLADSGTLGTNLLQS